MSKIEWTGIPYNFPYSSLPTDTPNELFWAEYHIKGRTIWVRLSKFSLALYIVKILQYYFIVIVLPVSSSPFVLQINPSCSFLPFSKRCGWISCNSWKEMSLVWVKASNFQQNTLFLNSYLHLLIFIFSHYLNNSSDVLSDSEIRNLKKGPRIRYIQCIQKVFIELNLFHFVFYTALLKKLLYFFLIMTMWKRFV